MDKKFLKKIIAQSPEDLQIISACCSEGKVKISDIKYLPSNKIFLISILRKDRENEDDNKIINSIIKFEFVQSTKSKNILYYCIISTLIQSLPLETGAFSCGS